jgi:hypothetical protein
MADESPEHSGGNPGTKSTPPLRVGSRLSQGYFSSVQVSSTRKKLQKVETSCHSLLRNSNAVPC